MRIYEAKPNNMLQQTLIAMSAEWERENSCHGYRKNEPADLEGNRIFVAEEAGQILGYLYGREEKANKTTSIMAEQTRCFEVEELYVIPEHRNKGVGKALFCLAEKQAMQDGIQFRWLPLQQRTIRKFCIFTLMNWAWTFGVPDCSKSYNDKRRDIFLLRRCFVK